MKSLTLCTTVLAVTLVVASGCSRRTSGADATIDDADILAPLPAPVEQPVSAIPVVQDPVPAPFPAPTPAVIQPPQAIAPLPAPTSDCDRVPTSKSGLVLFRQNCL